MTTAEIMAWLSDNTIAGMATTSVVLIILYLLISIPAYIRNQRRGYDVSTAAFIPFVNIFYLIKSFIAPARAN